MENREIKFRGWNKHTKSMHHNILEKMYRADENSIYNNFFINKNDEWIQLQFTGLYDKNGVEIYEGDIIKLNKTGRLIVEWYESFAMFIMRNIYDRTIYYNMSELQVSACCDVIGNIYENPELLKK